MCVCVCKQSNSFVCSVVQRVGPAAYDPYRTQYRHNNSISFITIIIAVVVIKFNAPPYARAIPWTILLSASGRTSSENVFVRVFFLRLGVCMTMIHWTWVWARREERGEPVCLNHHRRLTTRLTYAVNNRARFLDGKIVAIVDGRQLPQSARI